MKDFTKIPGFSKYVINEKGVVYSYVTNTFLEGSVNPDGYINFRLKADEGFTKTVGLHRLLALTFLPLPESEEMMETVNHKDGNKSNNSLDNLEWATFKRNQEHAGELGLTQKCIPVYSRCVDTGEIEYFPSMLECAKAEALSKDAISWRIRFPGRVFPERKQYSLNCKDWIENANTSDIRFGRSRSVVVRNALTKEEEIFETASQAAKSMGVSVAAVSTWLKDKNQPVVNRLQQLKWKDDVTPWRDVDNPFIDYEQWTNKKVVVSISPATGVTEIYLSAAECAKWNELTVTTLNQRLKTNFGTVYGDGKRYGYYSKKNVHGSHITVM